MNKWAIIGLGFISQKHIDAIKDIGDELVAACDIDESKRQKVPDSRFYTDYREMLKKEKLDYVAICTPNYLHGEMIQEAQKRGIIVLCEKPIVIDAGDLSNLPQENVFTVLQLRYNPELLALKRHIDLQDSQKKYYFGTMNLEMNRGDFYHQGWKGDIQKSGGLLFNIGVHYFDLLQWIFGEPIKSSVYYNDGKTAEGKLFFNNAEIKWLLSIEAPMDNQRRHLIVSGQLIDLTRHFDNLHTKVYEDVIRGRGITTQEASKAINMILKMNE